MMKSLQSALLLLAMLLPATGAAYDFEVDGIYYDIYGNGAAVTYGTNKYIGDVTIPETVTHAGTTYPVTTIGVSAFDGCSDLTSVIIPNSITAIGENAFKDCKGLTGQLVIPNSVTEIGTYAFFGCSGLTGELILPNSLTTINIEVFGRCSGLTGELVIPSSVTSIGTGAFEDCVGLTGELVIPNSVTSVGFGAFSGCSGLTSVTIPNSVTAISDYTFYGCNGLTSVTIPNSVTSIGSRAFYYCSKLMSATIPNSVTAIGGGAFMGCSSLTSVTIPNSVTDIGIYAFARCYGLTGEVVIPNSVTEISDGVFAWCNGLTNIIVESGNPNYDSRDNCNAIIETSSNTLIAGCISTVIPNSVTGIGNAAFCGLSALTGELVIPNSITWIGDGAYSQCTGLTSVTIPNSVTSIGYAAFYHYPNLKDVYSYITDLESVSVGYDIFYCNLDGVYSGRTLHVPYGTAESYQTDGHWYPYFGQIVEMDPVVGLPGDVNGDGEVNIADINAVIAVILGGNSNTAADVNGDGEVNIADINAVISIILGGGENPQPEHEYVDLGLPSGTLWATCNVGANSPEEYGDYFAWGETAPKEVYSWETYKWCNGSSRTMTKYCTKSSYGTVDNKTELDPEDDAAYVNWGSSWRMPTTDQIQELIDNCSGQWMTVNGVNGLLLTGPNGNTMFLPAADCRHHDYPNAVGSFVNNWSRTLDSDANFFAGLLSSISEEEWGWYCAYRDYGFSVRAVRVSQQ